MQAEKGIDVHFFVCFFPRPDGRKEGRKEGGKAKKARADLAGAVAAAVVVVDASSSGRGRRRGGVPSRFSTRKS